MIRVMLVDDHTLVRQGIRGLLTLAEGIEVVGEAGDGVEALERLAAARPDVLLLDVQMPRMTGLELLAQLPAGGPAVVLLTTFDDDAVALQGIRLGARGFLLKDVTLEELAGAIRSVAGGGSLIRPGVTERVRQGIKRLPQPAGEGPADPLTAREREVLGLIAGGLSSRQIAAALGTTEGTVKNQTASILSKLGVRDRTRAVLRALDLGLL